MFGQFLNPLFSVWEILNRFFGYFANIDKSSHLVTLGIVCTLLQNCNSALGLIDKKSIFLSCTYLHVGKLLGLQW